MNQEEQTTSTDSPEPLEHTPNGPIILSELTSPGFAAAMEQVEAVLIPIGAHEQHGPALPLSTDTLSAQVIGALTASLLAPRVALAPAVPWGVSWHHMDFPGTISLAETTLMAVVEDVVTSLHRHGVQRFILINAHGGNTAALQVVAERCHREHNIPMVASVFAYTLIADAAREELGETAIGHGGGDESAVVLATRPDLVVKGALGTREQREDVRAAQLLVRATGGVLPMSQQVASPSGANGDSTDATEEAGAAILSKSAARMRVIVEELLDLDVSLLQAGNPEI